MRAPGGGDAVVPSSPVVVLESAPAAAELTLVDAGDVVLPVPLVDPLAEIRDDVDLQVLPIFLDEAAELFPQAGEGLRAWRRNPRDDEAVADLRRTLHTFKGSARMAGAMRLGELTHLMESRLIEGDTPAPPSPELFEALEEDLDRIAHVLDGLRRGEFNVPLPGMAPVADAPVVDTDADAIAATAEPPRRRSSRWCRNATT